MKFHIKNKKKFFMFIASSLLIIAGIILGSWKLYDWYLSSRPYTYEALVQMRDQKGLNPKEDARSALKKGDVIVIYPKGHQWSETEMASSLYLRLNITDEEAKNLLSPQETNGEITKARAYRIKIENLKFNPDNLYKKQPFAKRVFDDKIMEKK